MQTLMLWLAGRLQRRQELRVAKAEKLANQLIIEADRDFAITLRILPPTPVQSVNNNLYLHLLAQGNAQQSGHPGYDGFGFPIPPRVQNAQRYQQMLGAMGGMLGGPMGGVLGGALGSAFGDILGAAKGRHH